MGMPSSAPLYIIDKGIASTAPYMSGLFNTVSFSAEKPSNTLRIFCFGGSTTYGRPYDAGAAYPRWLELLLGDLCPGKRFEVINAGGISYGSKGTAALVRDVLRFEPDLVTVEVGHNEFIEQKILKDFRTTAHDAIERMSMLNGLTDDQVLQALLEDSSPDRGSWGGSGTPAGGDGRDETYRHSPAPQRYTNRAIFPDNLDTILDITIPSEDCWFDSESAEDGVGNFFLNMHTIVGLCKDAGIPLILLEPISNLKDFSPIRSEHRPGLEPTEKREITGLLELVFELVDFDRCQEALTIADDLIQLDSLYAESHYAGGQALLGLGRSTEAMESLVKAKDLDAVPLRCTSRIKERLLGMAQQEGVDMILLSTAIEQRAGRNEGHGQVPGYETFVDHIHPTIATHQLAAELILDCMTERGMVRPSCSPNAERCKKVYDEGMASLDSRYPARADLNLACFFAWAGKPEALWALERATANLEENKAVVHALKGHVLMNEGAHWDAIGELEKAVELSQNNPDALSHLGTAYWHSDLTDDAMECFEKLMKTEEGVSDPLAHKNMALLYLEADEVQKAKEVLQSGMRRNPASVTLLAPYAQALASSGEYAKAISWMLRAAHLEPDDSNHPVDLAAYYARLGRKKDAMQLFNLAVERGFDDVHEIAENPETELFLAMKENGVLFQQLGYDPYSPARRRWQASLDVSGSYPKPVPSDASDEPIV